MEKEMLSLELERKKKKLDSWGRELNKREALTEREKQKLNEEKKHVYSYVSPNYMEQQSEINDNMRGVLIDWIIKVHDKLELKEETLFLLVNLLDRFLEKQVVAKNKLQLVGLIAFLIAGKYEEI